MHQDMANIFRNGKLYWVKFRDPQAGTVHRLSLKTGDRCHASLLCRKIELEVERRQPELRNLPLPEEICKFLPPVDEPQLSLALPESSPLPTQPQKPEGIRRPLGEVARRYLAWCRIENDSHHVVNKTSKLRKMFGRGVEDPTAPLDGPLAAKCLEDLEKDRVQEYIDSQPLSSATKRHYREVIHSLFEYALKNSLMLATNIHTPNPMSTLPSWTTKSRVITFLNDQEMDEQLKAVQPYPVLYAAVVIYLYAGLRREEALWLERERVEADLSSNILRVIYHEDDSDKTSRKPSKNSLKTGERPVSISPELKKILEGYLPHASGKWLLPTLQGKRWDKDNFSSRLREANRKADLPWSCMHFRHTYATRMARNGMTVFELAKQMGTSVEMLMKHYTAWFAPAAIR